MRFEECFKCGKHKLVSFNRNTDTGLTIEDIEGYQMTYGKNRGLFRCKNCKEDSKIIQRLLTNDLSVYGELVGGWTSIDELKKHYITKEND